MSNVPATRGNNEIFGRFAQAYGVNPSDVSRILKSTAFKVADKDNPTLEVTDEQMTALLVVADKYRLNPFIREIYAFVDKYGKGITPVIPIDGWARIANEHPQYDGVEFLDAEKTVKVGNKEVPEWIEAKIYRKDRSHPTAIREYFYECTRNTGPWGSHPARMLRHKAFMQSARIALGFGGVYDEDEAEGIATARIVDMQNAMSASIDITPAPALLPPPEEQFAAVIQNAGFADQQEKVAAYLNVCAKYFSKSVEEVKAEICHRPEDFTKTFPAWVKSVEQQKQAKQAESAAAPAEKPAPRTSEPQETPPRRQSQPHPEAAKITQPEVNPVAGEVFEDPFDGRADCLVTCPKNNKQVDELDCSSKPCRNGCPAFLD